MPQGRSLFGRIYQTVRAPRMKLYGYWRSGCDVAGAHRARLKGVPYEYQPVQPPDADSSTRSRTARSTSWSPCPCWSGTRAAPCGGSPRAWPSSTTSSSASPRRRSCPADPWLRARARQLAEIVNSGIQPFQTPLVLGKVKAFGGDDRAWVQFFLGRGFTALEEETSRTAGRYCVGDAPSFADCCLVPQLYSARRFKVDLTPFPTLTRIEAACEALPAFQAAHPDRQPDAVHAPR